MFYSEEYKHLLQAERAMSTAIDSDSAKPADIAQLARALVAVIDQKRAIRGVPDPKPADVKDIRKQRDKDKARGDGEPSTWKPKAKRQAPPAPAPAASSSTSSAALPVVPATGKPITPQQIEEAR